MSSRNLKFKLAKVLIAAAWADGRLANEELNILKDFLFGLPEISPAEWKKLMIYMESPIDAAESRMLLEDLLMDVKSRKDRRLVTETLDIMVASDGIVTSEEAAFVDEVKTAMDASASGFFGSLRNRMKGIVTRRRASGPAREDEVDDYTNNEVYHYLVHVKKNGDAVRPPEINVRQLCLSAGFMAWVLHSDLMIDEEDRQALERTLMDKWCIRSDEADVVAEAACERIVKGVDFNRLCRTYYETVDPLEYVGLVKSLESMAGAATRGRVKKLAGVQSVIKALKLSEALN